MAALGLHCCTWTFSRCGAQASHCGDFSCCGAWALGHTSSVAVVRGLRCPVIYGILLGRGSNLCPLHWRVDSQLPDHYLHSFCLQMLQLSGEPTQLEKVKFSAHKTHSPLSLSLCHVSSKPLPFSAMRTYPRKMRKDRWV